MNPLHHDHLIKGIPDLLWEKALVLWFWESLEHALKRGAKPLAEVVAYAATCDAYHVTAPDLLLSLKQ